MTLSSAAISKKPGVEFESQLAASDSNLQEQWTKWDAALEAGNTAEKTKIKDEMVALLDRRRYIRNLVRDVNEALEG